MATSSRTAEEPPISANPSSLEAEGQFSDMDSSLGEESSLLSTESIASSILQYRKINGRTYHSDHWSSKYFAPNDQKANETIDIQHHVLTLTLGGKLHLAPLSDNIEKVLDVGCGTGSWTIDFGDMYPKAQVIGVDLSPIQPVWVPPNVKFVVDNFKHDTWLLDDDSFDFIYMRWLATSVVDWVEHFKKAYRYLKPGAWLESFDTNVYIESDDGTVAKGTAMFDYGEILRKGCGKMGIPSSDFYVVRDQLQRKALEAAGFVNIQEKRFRIPTSEWPLDPAMKDIGLYSRAAIQNDVEGIVGLPASHIGYSKEEVAVYGAKFRKELCDMKIHGYYTTNVAWGQKPADV